MKNVLLLCMSPLSSTAKINKYTYESKKGSQFIEGVMTNEAPTKAVIGLLEEKGIDRILDMTRTAVNITGDAVCTTIVAHQNKALDKKVFYETE